MDDSDDYFQDTFELDDNDLALLDEAEAKYTQSISRASERASDSLPPQKRQKLYHRNSLVHEDILDVFLRTDGTYGVAAVGMEHGDEASVPKCLITTEQPTTACRVSPSEERSSTRLGERSFRQPSSRNTLHERSNAHQSGRNASEPIVNGSQSTSREHIASAMQSGLEAELASLKTTVEMLQLENCKVKAALQKAETSRFAKEGEVTMLRKKVEKTAQQHADVLIKLKESKETASHEQARIQKEMKQQMERLRTEYIFKQHETVSSSRKSILSTRTRRIAVGPQVSPVPVPPAMREWNSARPCGFNSADRLRDTPSARRQMSERQDRGWSNIGGMPRTSASDMRFPGFENSFLPSSPLNSPSRARQIASGSRNTLGSGTPTKGDKGKRATLGRAKNGVLSPVKPPSLTLKPPAGAAFEEVQMDDYIQDFDADIGISDGSPRARSKSVGTESSPNIDRRPESVGDLAFSDEIDRDFSSADVCPFEGIDWSEELHYILFSHISAVSDNLTFHFLLCADVPDRAYQQSCSAILEALGAKYKFSSLQELMGLIADKLVSIAIVLTDSGRPRHLRALFELLSLTMVRIPSFTQAIIQGGFDEQRPDDRLLRVFSGIVRRSPDAGKAHTDHEVLTLLLHSMLTLLEVTAWTVGEESHASLIPLMQSEGVLLILLDNKQPSAVISHAINMLVVLATHSSLTRPLLSSPNDCTLHVKQSNAYNAIRIPVLERLSGFLVDPGPLSTSRVDEDMSSILRFFSLLIVQNSEGRSTLLRSGTFIPCLIHYLTRLSALLWEDDELTMQSPNHARSTVQNMKQALRLLHCLVLEAPSDDPVASDFDFRQKLFYVPHAMFNGLPHMFIVMIGRLSYADPPDWLDAGLQAEIEKLTEPARDLMDLVIEGPESDIVWVAYQDSEGESVTENDDEIEAHLLDADDLD